MAIKQTEVIVVGAGPVGLFTALCLAEQGIQVEVFDEQWRTTARSYALALHPASISLLEAHGLASKVIESGHRVDDVGYYDRVGRRAGFTYGKLASAHPYLLIFPQHTLEAVLEQKLADRKVKVHWNHRLASLKADNKQVHSGIEVLEKYSAGYSVTHTEWLVQREFEIESAYVIGADGHRSAVRRKLDIPYETVGNPEVFAVYEFSARPAAGNEVKVLFGDDHAGVLWPMRDGRYRFSFQLTDDEALEAPRLKSRLSVQVGDQAFPHLDEAGLKRFIAERAPWFDARIEDIYWSLGIRFDRRLAREFGRGRGWLAGDSAHLAAPVAMHSMNVGLREGADLARILAASLKGTAGAGDLASYNDERLEEWKQLLGLEAPATLSDKADPWVARNAARFLPCAPASGADLRSVLGQLGLELPQR